MRHSVCSAAVTLLVASAVVVAQRTSPQFSFPSAQSSPAANQFGVQDLFNSAQLGQGQSSSLFGGQSTSSFGSNQSPSFVGGNQPALFGGQSFGGGGSGQFGVASQPSVNSAGPQSTLVQLPPAPPPLGLPTELTGSQQLIAQSAPSVQQQSQQQQPPPQEPIQFSRPSLSLGSLTAPSPSTSTSASRSFQLGGQRGEQAQPSVASSTVSSVLPTTSSVSVSRRQPQQQSGARAPPQQQAPSAAASVAAPQAGRAQQRPAASAAAQTPPQSQQSAVEAARKTEASAASLAAAAGHNYQCPDSFGYFRHHTSCDKYWNCENGTATLKLCGNGLMFDDSDPKRENCAYPFSVDCGADRTDLEPPISTPHCPRLYGLFADNSNCRVFYSCWNGEASKYECPPGLAYDNEQRVCVWADLVGRCDQSEVSDGFVCPDATEVDQPGHYTRHAHPTDCRKFYVCIEGVARPYGCSFGSVFNVDSLQCDEPENVSGCEKYYGDLDPKLAKKLARENAQQHAGNSSPTTTPRSPK